MRRKINLDLQSLDSYNILVHGGRGAGKTHLGGDFLRTEREAGSIKVINIKGEDGLLTLKGWGFGEVGETAESFEDFDAMIRELEAKPVQALLVDSAPALEKLLMFKVTKGAQRLPMIIRGQEGGNEWGEMHFLRWQTMGRLRYCAKYMMMLAHSDISMDQLKQQLFVTPDLAGRGAIEIMGSFDFVGYLEPRVTGPNMVERTFYMTPNTKIATRQRLPKQITEEIKISEGRGGWTAIKGAIAKAFEGREVA